MTDSSSSVLCRAILRVAGWLVPTELRMEWLEEWQSELWYVCESFHPGRTFRESPTGFCIGAVPDAIWMWNHAECAAPRFRLPIRSPLGCIALLLVLASVTILAAFVDPQIRKEMTATGDRGPQDLAVLSTCNSSNDSQLATSGEQYEGWRNHSSSTLAGASFYEPTDSSLIIGSGQSNLMVGWASEDLFQLLRFETDSQAMDLARRIGAVPIFLSQRARQRYFQRESIVSGRTLKIAGRKAVILGTVPDYAADLPGDIDVWALDDAHGMALRASRHFAYGYLIVRLEPKSTSEQTEPLLTASTGEGTADTIYIARLSSIARRHRMQPLLTFLHAVVLACVVLPFILSIFLCPSADVRNLSRTVRLRQGMFLALKMILLLPPLFCGPLILSRFGAFGSRESVCALQGCLTFTCAIFGAHWCLWDQLRRCPRCFRILAHPAHVGEPSRSFLSWSGMELMCLGGHGLLHVPDFPTSWFSHNRWHVLDSSWRALFQA
jgi:hypothetical protein